MSIFELREWIEKSIPAWTLLTPFILLIGIVIYNTCKGEKK